ncbi:MAG: M50 family metallopeptidase [Clostridia bacterium]
MQVLSTILYVILAVFILLLMILIHELGHYVAGRILHFKIDEFSIGFGKALFTKVNKRGEKISLRLFPVGGYCAFSGDEDEEDNPKNVTQKTDSDVEVLNEAQAKKKERAHVNPNKGLLFNQQKPWKRIIVFLAGVTFNFISAIVFSFILLISFGYDVPEVVNVDTRYQYAVVQGETLQAGDVITEVEGIKIDFIKGNTWPKLLGKYDINQPILITLTRNGVETKMQIKLSQKLDNKGVPEVNENNAPIKTLGVEVKAHPLPFFEALGHCFYFTIGLAWIVLSTLWQLITFQIPLNQIGGTIATISVIAHMAQQGIANIFILMPLIAANLAVFNLLPFPALDGSHVVFTLIEWIRKKPINRKVENMIHTIGLIALFTFVVVVDIIYFLK